MHKYTFLISALFLSLVGCATGTSQSRIESDLGSPIKTLDFESLIDQPGTIAVETITSATWELPLSGPLNLDHPKARAAGLTDRPEPIKVFLYVIKHPIKGTYFVDTGMSEQFKKDPSSIGANWLIQKFMNLEKLDLKNPTEKVVEANQNISGIFFTHLHFDHISGLSAIPKLVPIYVGRGEGSKHTFKHMFTEGMTDTVLQGRGPLREWKFYTDKSLDDIEVIDIFGDQMAFALFMPGHTEGSTAYLFRTSKGPVLLTGDVCHTRWGWDHQVEPGTFTEDKETGIRSLAKLQELVRRHPKIQLRLGHQD